MRDELVTEQPRSHPEMSEYYKLELSQVVERINSLDSLRTQLATFLGGANFTVLAVGLSLQKAGIVCFSALITIVFILMDMYDRRAMIAFAYRGLQLQNKFAPNDEETFLKILPGVLYSQARKIANLGTLERRKNALRKVSIPFKSMFFWVPILAAIVETTLGVILWIAFYWPLF